MVFPVFSPLNNSGIYHWLRPVPGAVSCRASKLKTCQAQAASNPKRITNQACTVNPNMHGSSNFMPRNHDLQTNKGGWTITQFLGWFGNGSEPCTAHISKAWLGWSSRCDVNEDPIPGSVAIDLFLLCRRKMAKWFQRHMTILPV